VRLSESVEYIADACCGSYTSHSADTTPSISDYSSLFDCLAGWSSIRILQWRWVEQPRNNNIRINCSYKTINWSVGTVEISLTRTYSFLRAVYCLNRPVLWTHSSEPRLTIHCGSSVECSSVVCSFCAIAAAVPPRPQDGTACFSHRTLRHSVQLCDRL